MVISALKGGLSSAGVAVPGFTADRSYDSGEFNSGSLTKMELKFYKEAAGASCSVNGVSSLTFFLNPSSITMTKKIKIDMHEDSSANKGKPKAVSTEPIELKFGELWFDTYDTREHVRKKYITTLEGLLDPVAEQHYVPVVGPVWGEFNATKNSPDYYFYVQSLNVTYTMFLPDGTPVRAKVTLALMQANPEVQQVEFQSPDHAKLYTVIRGDTLQSIAMSSYDDPREWRRIADLNGITDPMSLKPGTKLLVPPILL